jgi:hypothetical protein
MVTDAGIVVCPDGPMVNRALAAVRLALNMSENPPTLATVPNPTDVPLKRSATHIGWLAGTMYGAVRAIVLTLDVVQATD